MKKVQIGTMPKVATGVREAFNRLRVNLGFCGGLAKTVMITSSVSGEGKTFVSVQLWKQLAESGISTLLIDCDLQNSPLCNKYIMSDARDLDGITEYLSGQVELEDVLYETDVQNGYILPVTSSMERTAILFADDRFSQMVETCKKKFGCVLIDTPSIERFPDVMNIATHCDGVVLVVRSASTPCKAVGDCVQIFQDIGTPLFGIVLNRFDVNNKSISYYYKHRN